MSDVKITATRAGDLHNQVNERWLDEAAKRKVTLSHLLEEADPSDSHDELSAFERQLEVAGIVTRTDRSEGYYADTLEAFGESDVTRVLLAEFMDRTYRSVGAATGKQQRMISSDYSGVSREIQPILNEALQDQFIPSVPLSELVAFTTTIDDNYAKAMYVTSEPDEFGLKRVAEGAVIPEARLALGTKPINLSKFGRAMVVTYEALRRTPIDAFAMFIRMAAIQAEMDKVAAVMDVLVNGDGNPDTSAQVLNLTDLDENATAGELTLKAWTKFKLSFRQPYSLNSQIVQEDVYLQQLFLPVGTDGNAILLQIPSGSLGGFVPMNDNLGNNVSVGLLDDAPANAILGFDSRFAIQRFVEAGSNITETMRWIRNQTQEIVFSETEGYAAIQPKAKKLLNLAD